MPIVFCVVANVGGFFSPRCFILLMFDVVLIQLEHLLVGEQDRSDRVFRRGYGVGTNCVHYLDTAPPYRIIYKAFYAAGQMRDQLKPWGRVDDCFVNPWATPAGDEDFDRWEVWCNRLDIPEGILRNKAGNASDGVEMIFSKKLILDHRVHQQCRRWLLGHGGKNTP